MKKSIVSILFLSSIALASCGADATATTSDSNTNTELVDPVGLEAEAGATNTTGDAQLIENNGTTPPPAAVPAGENPYAHLKGINPAHGQPGHRCDINVGEPLNSPPGPAAAAPQVMTPPPASAPAMNMAPADNGTMPQMPAQKTEPGFSGKANPAHGQPGHRCDIKEGEILP